MTTADRAKALIAQQAEVDPETLGDNTRLIEDLGFDDLEVLELAMELEDEFEIESVSNQNLDGVKTVGDIVRHLVARVGDFDDQKTTD